MQQHNLEQGSAAWHAYRANHFNASDAPAMLGLSKYKSRTQLMHEIHTGITPDVDSATQKRFDDGHRFEALARPLAEALIGEELSPVIGSEGKLSASFDGLTLLEDVAWEHKTLNAEIRACNDIGDLPIVYKIQMQQQLMVSGAEKCLFTATTWDSNDQLVESKEFWFMGDAELAYDITEGWNQFEKDLALYMPVEVIEKPKAQVIMALPTLAIQIKGEVTLSNLPAFKEAATAFIANISTELVTDEDFSNAEATVKFCKAAEDDLEIAKKSAIAQTASIDELMRTIDFIKDQLRDKRLALDKLVVKEKDCRKLQIVQKAQHDYLNHVNALYAETKPIELVIPKPDFAVATKNKKTIASMQEAVNQSLVNAKMEADKVAYDIRTKQAWFNENASHYQFLFADMQQIIYKQIDDFNLLVSTRIADHKRDEQAKKDLLVDSQVKKVVAADVAIEQSVSNVVQSNSAELRAAVVEQQDVISSFFKARGFTEKKEHEYRAVIVEFIKHQETMNLKISA